MNENKRFTIVIDSNGRKSLWDSERTEEEPLIAYSRFDEIIGIDNCCELLNDLNYENEYLKSKNELLIKGLKDYNNAIAHHCSCEQVQLINDELNDFRLKMNGLYRKRIWDGKDD